MTQEFTLSAIIDNLKTKFDVTKLKNSNMDTKDFDKDFNKILSQINDKATNSEEKYMSNPLATKDNSTNPLSNIRDKFSNLKNNQQEKNNQNTIKTENTITNKENSINDLKNIKKENLSLNKTNKNISQDKDLTQNTQINNEELTQQNEALSNEIKEIFAEDNYINQNTSQPMQEAENKTTTLTGVITEYDTTEIGKLVNNTNYKTETDIFNEILNIDTEQTTDENAFISENNVVFTNNLNQLGNNTQNTNTQQTNTNLNEETINQNYDKNKITLEGFKTINPETIELLETQCTSQNTIKSDLLKEVSDNGFDIKNIEISNNAISDTDNKKLELKIDTKTAEILDSKNTTTDLTDNLTNEITDKQNLTLKVNPETAKLLNPQDNQIKPDVFDIKNMKLVINKEPVENEISNDINTQTEQTEDIITTEIESTESENISFTDTKNEETTKDTLLNETDILEETQENNYKIKMMEADSSTDNQNFKENPQDTLTKMNIENLETNENKEIKITNDFKTILNRSTEKVQTPNSIKTTQENEIINQIKDKIGQIKGNFNSKVNMILQPEHLGKVSIEIMSNKGIVKANIVAQNPMVKEMLEKNLESLRNTLTSQGINVANVNVQIEKSAEAQQENFNFNRQAMEHNFENSSSNKNQQNQNLKGDKRGVTNDEEFEFETEEKEIDSEETKTTNVHNGKVDLKV